MPPPSPRHVDGRLARRLFGLFVLVALLPLAVSDWLSHTAVTQLADELQRQGHARTTRQASRQVYDRLLAAQWLMASWPATPLRGRTGVGLPGLGTVFLHAVQLDEDSRPQWASDTDPLVAAAAEAAGKSVNAAGPATQRQGGVNLSSRLHLDPAVDEPTALWLVGGSGASTWAARIDPSHLWAPVREAGDGSAWRVTDADGRLLLSVRGADYPVGLPGPGDATAEASTIDADTLLFMAGGFGSSDWRFVQRTPRPQVNWQGWPLRLWLGLVAAATLLSIAWLARRQIRRMLEPLERLTEGTRRLAAGQGRTRVQVQRDDEIGALAGDFNRMAERIEAQFGDLAGLTAIDRDILDGTALDRVVERVLCRLSADAPGLIASIAHVDGGRQLTLAWLPEDLPDGPAHRTVHRLDEASLERLHGLDADRSGPADGWPDEPWLRPAPTPATGQPGLLLPLRLAGRTCAVMALRLPATVPSDFHQRACDLRDRLSVAMAARAREDELRHRAAHDSLTGLANRYGLHQRLDTWLQQDPPRLAVLFVDLDHFKDVNDSRGHAAGDTLLCEASARLLALAPAGALVSRQGGDEFALVLPGAGSDEATACARAAVAALARPFVLEDAPHVLGASVGIALCPQHGRDRGELLRRADVALYAAKSGGRNRDAMFAPELDAAANDRMRLLAELRQAIARSEFVVYFQPRILAADGSIRSAEALVRWQHPERGLLMPVAFIGLAESSGLIDGIGGLVLEATCRQLAQWRRQGLALDRVSVNVSPQQLNSGRLPEQVRSLLERYRLPGRMLELEVTESLLVGDSGAAAAQLAQLRETGITIALDDFGTGYSSMATLRQLPIDVMKVDRAFVTDVCDDKGALAVASAIVAMAQAMSLHLVAEGVETEAQARLLGRLGCDELQGFLYSRALPATQFERLPGLHRAEPSPAEAAESEPVVTGMLD